MVPPSWAGLNDYLCPAVLYFMKSIKVFDQNLDDRLLPCLIRIRVHVL